VSPDSFGGMKVLHIFIRDLGGEFKTPDFPAAARALGEPVPENISNVYSEYFLIAGLAPLRTRLRREEVLVEGARALLTSYAKLYNYGVLLLEYELQLPKNFPDPSLIFKARSFELPGRGIVALEKIRDNDLEEAQRRLLPFLKREYDVPLINDHFHLFIDAHPREEAEFMGILLPGTESYPDKMKRLVVTRIDLGDESEKLVFMGSRAYLRTELDASDVVNFIELSRVQLYELKIYDYMLDQGIENTYGFLDQLPREESIMPLIWLRSNFKSQVRHVLRLIEMRMDLVDLVKDITNTTKVTHDPYFERLYRRLNETFQVDVWFRSVKEKIEEMEDIQRMILSRIDMSRSTALEMTIIILILIEVVMPLYHLAANVVRGFFP